MCGMFARATATIWSATIGYAASVYYFRGQAAYTDIAAERSKAVCYKPRPRVSVQTDKRPLGAVYSAV